MQRVIFLILFAALSFSHSTKCFGQNVAIKTNVLYWAATTPNLSLEFKTGKKTTIDISATYNPIGLSNQKQVKNTIIQPEFRVWQCERFNKGFFGVHGLFGIFNVAKIHMPLDLFPLLKHNRVEGNLYGGGVSYGYHWYLGPHWNLEAVLGVGYFYADYKVYRCGDCRENAEKGYKHYIGPTRIGVSFVYLFKQKRK